ALRRTLSSYGVAVQRAFVLTGFVGVCMALLWWLWIRNRWRGLSAAGIALLAVLIVWFIASGSASLGVIFLGDADAPRVTATGGSVSGTILPRSGDPNAPINVAPDPRGDAPDPNS